jgi:hypothetical protein
MLSVVAGAAETDDPQATIGMGNVPAGTTGVVTRVVFVTEERGSVSTACIGIIPISNPLPDVPCYIEDTVGAGPIGITSHGRRVAHAIVRVELVRIELLTPGTCRSGRSGLGHRTN